MCRKWRPWPCGCAARNSCSTISMARRPRSAAFSGWWTSWCPLRPSRWTPVFSRPHRPRSGLNALLPTVRGWGGWLLLLLSLLCLFIVFPPYPYLFTAFGDPEYRAQMLVAGLGGILLVLALYLPADLKSSLQILLAILG